MTRIASNEHPWTTTLAALTVRSLGGSLYQLSATAHRLTKISDCGTDPLPPNRHYLVGGAEEIRKAYLHLLAKRLFEAACPVLGTVIVYAWEHKQVENSLIYFAKKTTTGLPSPFWTLLRGDVALVEIKEQFLRARYTALHLEMRSWATGEGSIWPKSGHLPSLASVSPLDLSPHCKEEPDDVTITPKNGFFPVTPSSPFVNPPIEDIMEAMEPGSLEFAGKKFTWILTI